MKRYVRHHLPAGDFFLAEENGALTNAGFMLSESDLMVNVLLWLVHGSMMAE